MPLLLALSCLLNWLLLLIRQQLLNKSWFAIRQLRQPVLRHFSVQYTSLLLTKP